MEKRPIRTCIVCRGKFPKNRLNRFVWQASGLVADNEQVMNGRGGYCCNRQECLSQLDRAENRLRRVFRQLR